MNRKHASAREFQRKLGEVVNDEPSQDAVARSSFAVRAIDATLDLCRALGIEVKVLDDTTMRQLCDLTRTDPEPPCLATAEPEDIDFVALVQAVCELNLVAARVEVATGLDCDGAFDFVSQDKLDRQPMDGMLAVPAADGFDYDRKGLARLLRKQYPRRSRLFKD